MDDGDVWCRPGKTVSIAEWNEFIQDEGVHTAHVRFMPSMPRVAVATRRFICPGSRVVRETVEVANSEPEAPGSTSAYQNPPGRCAPSE